MSQSLLFLTLLPCTNLLHLMPAPAPLYLPLAPYSTPCPLIDVSLPTPWPVSCAGAKFGAIAGTLPLQGVITGPSTAFLVPNRNKAVSKSTLPRNLGTTELASFLVLGPSANLRMVSFLLLGTLEALDWGAFLCWTLLATLDCQGFLYLTILEILD